MSTNSPKQEAIFQEVSEDTRLVNKTAEVDFSKIDDIGVLQTQIQLLQAQLLRQQEQIHGKDKDLKIARASSKKLRRELHLIQHIGELVDTILNNLERINLEDHILFFNYLLNIIPEQMQCNIRYYIPTLLGSVVVDDKTNLFVSLFQNAYGMMQSKIDFGPDSQYGSHLIQKELTEEEAVGKEGVFITIENDTVGYIEILRSEKQKEMIPDIESSVNRILQYINSHITQLQYSIILHANNKLIQNHVTLIQTDLLTGINSRRGFFEKTEQLLRNYPNKPAVIIAMDVDHFKKVNDIYGHAGGDVVLRTIAKILENELKNYLADMNGRNLIQNPIFGEVGRIGGEEFVMQLLGVSMEQAYMVSENMRAVVERELKKFSESDTVFQNQPITISMGISELSRNSSSYSSAEQTDALRRADKALYQAKAAGRNRVVLFRPEVEDIKTIGTLTKPMIMIRKMVRPED